jgi:DNA-directed RNA polymerase specialized sigma24 family protein
MGNVESDDAGLWGRSLKGEGEAFRVLYARHRDRIFRHAYRLSGDRHDAEDIMATAFLELWRCRAKVRIVEGSVLPWLLVTTTNAARSRGAEMARHADVTAALGTHVYFCDPASPWQRGSNENANGLLRQYFRKGTDLKAVDEADLRQAVDEINDPPPRCPRMGKRSDQVRFSSSGGRSTGRCGLRGQRFPTWPGAHAFAAHNWGQSQEVIHRYDCQGSYPNGSPFQPWITRLTHSCGHLGWWLGVHLWNPDRAFFIASKCPKPWSACLARSLRSGWHLLVRSEPLQLRDAAPATIWGRISEVIRS